MSRKLLGLPRKFALPGNATVTIDKLQLRRVPQAVQLFREEIAEGGSLGEDEFDGDGGLSDFVHSFADDAGADRPGRWMMEMVEAGTEKMLATITLFPSKATRSTFTLVSQGYLVVERKNRNEAIERLLKDHMYQSSWATGYIGHLGRTPTTQPIRGPGELPLGVVPHGVRLSTRGLCDDLIHQRDFRDFDASEYDKRINRYMKNIQLLQENSFLKGTSSRVKLISNNSYLGSLHLFANQCITLSNGQEFMIKRATADETCKLNDLILNSAHRGEGFGIDEFTADGIFNRNLLHESESLVAVFRREVVGGAIFGSSALCRTPAAATLGGYIVVARQFRRLGLGQLLFNVARNHAKRNEFKSVLTDVYSCNSQAMRFMKKNGFVIVGSLPNCGCIHGHGLTDCVLFYKEMF